MEAIRALIQEVRYWYHIVASGGEPQLITDSQLKNIPKLDSEGRPVNKYAAVRQFQAKLFINSIPGLQEKCCHEIIPRRPTRSSTPFNKLADDEVMLICTFLDSRSILTLSKVCFSKVQSTTYSIILNSNIDLFQLLPCVHSEYGMEKMV